MGTVMSLKKEDLKKKAVGDKSGTVKPVSPLDPSDPQKPESAQSKKNVKGDKKQKSAAGKDKKLPEHELTNAEALKMLKTTLYDPRFPNQNQTRNCYQNYLDYHRCLKVKNDENYCEYYKWAYNELCPRAWTDKWDTQREMGIFAGRI